MFKATYEVTAFIKADTLEEATEKAKAHLDKTECNLGVIGELVMIQPWGSSLETE